MDFEGTSLSPSCEGLKGCVNRSALFPSPYIAVPCVRSRTCAVPRLCLDNRITVAYDGTIGQGEGICAVTDLCPDNSAV